MRSGKPPALDALRDDPEHDAVGGHGAAAPQARQARVLLVKALGERATPGPVGQELCAPEHGHAPDVRGVLARLDHYADARVTPKVVDLLGTFLADHGSGWPRRGGTTWAWPGALRRPARWRARQYASSRETSGRTHRRESSGGADLVDEPVLARFLRVEGAAAAHVLCDLLGGPARGLRETRVESPEQLLLLSAVGGDLSRRRPDGTPGMLPVTLMASEYSKRMTLAADRTSLPCDASRAPSRTPRSA